MCGLKHLAIAARFIWGFVGNRHGTLAVCALLSSEKRIQAIAECDD